MPIPTATPVLSFSLKNKNNLKKTRHELGSGIKFFNFVKMNRIIGF